MSIRLMDVLTLALSSALLALALWLLRIEL
jgi:hypothetical protein